MNDKEFRRLKRTELIEIIYYLQEEQEKLKQENLYLKERLEQRTLKLENAGSIAQAALVLNDVFLAADKAASQYLESVRELQPQPQNAKEKKESSSNSSFSSQVKKEDVAKTQKYGGMPHVDTEHIYSVLMQAQKAISNTLGQVGQASQMLERARQEADEIVERAQQESRKFQEASRRETLRWCKEKAEELLTQAKTEANHIRQQALLDVEEQKHGNERTS